MSDISGILEDLAAGRITPDRAATLIAEAQQPGRAEQDAAASQPDEPTARRGSEQTTDQQAGGDTDEQAAEMPGPDADQPTAEQGDARRTDDLLDDAKQFASNAASRLRRAWAAVSDDPAKAADADPGTGSPSSPSSAPTPSSPKTPTADSSSAGKGNRGVERVAVRSVGRRVKVVADASVSTVTVEGPHLLRRNGATVEVTSDGDLGPSLRDFSLIRPPKSREDLRTVGFGKQIVVRVNPSIVVDAEVTAGSLKVVGVPVLGKVRVTTGSATLEGQSQIGDALVQAGTATIHGPIKQGRSVVRVESGSLNVKLAEGANVTVKGDAQLGRVSWPVEGKARMDELVVGNGSAKLDLAVVMGHISIRIDGEQD